jgi:hypothetical protein
MPLLFFVHSMTKCNLPVSALFFTDKLIPALPLYLQSLVSRWVTSGNNALQPSVARKDEPHQNESGVRQQYERSHWVA